MGLHEKKIAMWCAPDQLQPGQILWSWRDEHNSVHETIHRLCVNEPPFSKLRGCCVLAVESFAELTFVTVFHRDHTVNLVVASDYSFDVAN